ncbi:viperin family antiviral radical SAM protein [Terasakiella pusilla]|uniref:viperin family antiviral radical SAM protein n=1 Tax=Terasakiella pusilla TaxID=64973 RepID=UPI003AA9DC35
MAAKTSPTHYLDELEINWHLIETCNFNCRYCFAKWDTFSQGKEIWKDRLEAEYLLKQLYTFFSPGNSFSSNFPTLQWKTIRLNLVGGEPTLLGKHLIQVADIAQEMGFKLSLITNGSKLPKTLEISNYLDTLGISIDSAISQKNIEIGRFSSSGKTLTLDQYQNLVLQTREINPSLKIKVNTVVNAANFDEDFSPTLLALRPDRWKVMRVLPTLTDAMKIEDQDFASFISRHRKFKAIMSTEDNNDMLQSYIMIDPYGRFFQNRRNHQSYAYSSPITDVGIQSAFKHIIFDPEVFSSRYAHKNK